MLGNITNFSVRLVTVIQHRFVWIKRAYTILCSSVLEIKYYYESEK